MGSDPVYDIRQLFHSLLRNMDESVHVAMQKVTRLDGETTDGDGHLNFHDSEIGVAGGGTRREAVESHLSDLFQVSDPAVAHEADGAVPAEQCRHHLTAVDGKFDLERVACLGCCALAPVMVVDDKVYARMTPKKIASVISQYADRETKAS